MGVEAVLCEGLGGLEGAKNGGAMTKGSFVRGGMAQYGSGSEAMGRVGGLDGAKNGGGMAKGGLVRW